MTTYTTTFIADASGGTLTFVQENATNFYIDDVSIKELISPAVVRNFSIKEFLYGSDDEGETIFMRADTQQLQMNSNFEIYSNPIGVITRVQRGAMVKCFVALDDEDFYELEGNVTKGVSIVKIHSKGKSDIPTPPNTREIRVSWRDSSKQLCRILQSSIVFIPGTMDQNE